MLFISYVIPFLAFCETQCSIDKKLKLEKRDIPQILKSVNMNSKYPPKMQSEVVENPGF